MSNAVEKFLAQKRAAQQKSFSPQINSIAPPIYERYGIKPPMSGEYTGKGADGVTQATMPTQRRIDSTGNPYIVDENEMLVIDSNTLNDYGGPEALDKVIQANRPGRQFACGGVPTKDRFFTGGIPSNRQFENIQTRPRAISSDQMRLLSEIRDGARRFQGGGTPTKTENPDWGDKFNEIKSLGKPFNTGQIKQKIDPLNLSFNVDKPIKQNIDPLNLSFNVPNTVIKTDPIKQNIDPLNLSFNVPNNVVKTDPLKQNIDPLNLNFQVPNVGGDVSIGGTGAKSYSPKDIDEMMFQRQMARMGSQQESERAAEAQRGLQAGLSEREVQGQGAISDVGRREAQAGATADFAINQAQRLDEQEKENKAAQERQREFDEGTRRFNVQTGQWEKTFEQGLKQTDIQNKQWEQQFGAQNKQWDLQFNSAKQKDSLNTLLAAKDYKGAAELFKGIYGQSINFSALEDAEKAGKFNEGFNNMLGLIASGTKWEDAVAIMKKDGSFSKMGMTETDLYKFYSQAQLNNDPMYKYINTVDGWVKNKLISQNEADNMIALFKYNLTNPNGLEVLDGFAVKDKGGKEVGFFTTKEAADKFVTDNKDKGYISTPVKSHVGIKGSSNNVVNDNNNNNNNNNNLTDLQAHSNFIDSLPSDTPGNLTEWFDVEMWKTAGKPKDYAALKTWMGDTNKVTSYLKTKYPAFNLDVMSAQDKSLVLESIKNGNVDLIEKFRYNTEAGDEKNRADRFSNYFVENSNYVEMDDKGNPVITAGEKFIESLIVQPGKIIEIQGKNGKQNLFVKSLYQEKNKYHGYTYYYDVVDVKTGIVSKIILEGRGAG